MNILSSEYSVCRDCVSYLFSFQGLSVKVEECLSVYTHSCPKSKSIFARVVYNCLGMSAVVERALFTIFILGYVVVNIIKHHRNV